jgi:hypothetical protein
VFSKYAPIIHGVRIDVKYYFGGFGIPVEKGNRLLSGEAEACKTGYAPRGSTESRDCDFRGAFETEDTMAGSENSNANLADYRTILLRSTRGLSHLCLLDKELPGVNLSETFNDHLGRGKKSKQEDPNMPAHRARAHA